MELKTFVEQSQNRDWWQGQAAIFFIVDTDYPILFFSQMFEKLLPVIGPIRSLNLSDHENSQSVRASCESSFLGSKSYYWCKHLNALDAKKRALWLEYFRHYQGPNCILVCVNQVPVGLEKQVAQVAIQDLSGTSDVQQMLAWAGVNDLKLRCFIAAELCKRSKKISLDTICLIARYAQLAGIESSSIIPRMLDTTIMPEKSLFTLSGFLLAHNAQQFFCAWASVAADFPEIFWISYWSDVCWRAYHFAQLMQAGKIAEAKQLGTRLPFSFLQRDWKAVNMSLLKDAIISLYSIDRDLKNGAGNGYAMLELIFLRLLSGKKATVNPSFLLVE